MSDINKRTPEQEIQYLNGMIAGLKERHEKEMADKQTCINELLSVGMAPL